MSIESLHPAAEAEMTLTSRSSASTVSTVRSRCLLALVFIVAFGGACVWQAYEGAFSSELGGHPDEAAHYVTGLMVRDYLASGLHRAPMAYAQSYYEHYPKIALGVWPPVFYLVQAAWTLPFSPSRLSVILLMAALAATVALVIFAAVSEETGALPALVVALLWLSLPLVREYYGMVMAEMLSTIFMFGAALCFGRFLDRGRTGDILWFGALAGLAIMTKGTGVALALMALFALILSRRWRLLLRPALWTAAFITGVIAGPWTWKFREAGLGGWEQPTPSWSWSREAIGYYLEKLSQSLGLGLIALALLGLVILLRRKTVRPGLWISAGSLIAAICVFQVIMPVGKEARHLIPAIPPALLFAASGLAFVGNAFSRFGQRAMNRPRSVGRSLARCTASGAVLAAALAAFFAALGRAKNDRCNGFEAIAERYARDCPVNRPALISSDATGEGMFIAEVAMHDPHRPSRTVLRASKELASSQWSGRDYKSKFESPAKLLEYLASTRIAAVIVDESVPDVKRQPHEALLADVMAAHAAAFKNAANSSVIRGGSVQPHGVHLYEAQRSPGFRPVTAREDPEETR